MAEKEMTTLKRVEAEPWEDGPAYVVMLDGRPIGRIAKRRHTYRTTYSGERYGYDRTHWCWDVDVPGQRVGLCYPSRTQAQRTVLAVENRP